MAVKVGSSTTTKIYVGSKVVTKRYVGSTLVYNYEAPISKRIYITEESGFAELVNVHEDKSLSIGTTDQRVSVSGSETLNGGLITGQNTNLKSFGYLFQGAQGHPFLEGDDGLISLTSDTVLSLPGLSYIDGIDYDNNDVFGIRKSADGIGLERLNKDSTGTIIATSTFFALTNSDWQGIFKVTNTRAWLVNSSGFYRRLAITSSSPYYTEEASINDVSLGSGAHKGAVMIAPNLGLSVVIISGVGYLRYFDTNADGTPSASTTYSDFSLGAGSWSGAFSTEYPALPTSVSR